MGIIDIFDDQIYNDIKKYKGGNKMNKKELVESVVEKTGFKVKEAEKSVNVIIESITEALKKGDKVQLIGFGTFEVRQRAARTGHNPQTGKEINIPATKVPAFKPGKALKDVVK